MHHDGGAAGRCVFLSQEEGGKKVLRMAVLQHLSRVTSAIAWEPPFPSALFIKFRTNLQFGIYAGLGVCAAQASKDHNRRRRSSSTLIKT
jgi:hypothetical protein